MEITETITTDEFKRRLSSKTLLIPKNACLAVADNGKTMLLCDDNGKLITEER